MGFKWALNWSRLIKLNKISITVDRSLLTQMCWHSCPCAHGWKPEETQGHLTKAWHTVYTVTLMSLSIGPLPFLLGVSFLNNTLSYVSMFSGQHLIHIPLDIRNCKKCHCWHRYVGSHDFGHKHLQLNKHLSCYYSEQLNKSPTYRYKTVRCPFNMYLLLMESNNWTLSTNSEQILTRACFLVCI